MGKNGKTGRKEIVNQTQEALLAQILLVLTSAWLTGATAISTQWLGQTWRKCVWGHVSLVIAADVRIAQSGINTVLSGPSTALVQVFWEPGW